MKRTWNQNTFRRPILGIVLIWMFYSAFGFFFIPFLTKKFVNDWAVENLNGILRLEKIQFNPYTLSGSIQGIGLQNHPSKIDSEKLENLPPLFSLSEISFNLDLIQPWINRRTLVVRDIQLTQIQSHVVRDLDGNFNFNSLFIPKEEPEEIVNKSDPEVLPKLAIELLNLRLSQSSIHFDDEKNDRKVQISSNEFIQVGKIRVDFNNTEIPDKLEKKSPFTLSIDHLSIPEHSFSLTDNSNRTHARLDLLISKIDLKNVHFGEAGEASFHLSGRFNESPIEVNGTFNIEKLKSQGSMILKDFSFHNLNPFIQKHLPIEIEGILNTSSDWAIDASDLSSLKGSVRNSLQLARFSAKTPYSPIVSWEQLDIQNTNISLNSKQVDIESFQIQKPIISVELDSNGVPTVIKELDQTSETTTPHTTEDFESSNQLWEIHLHEFLTNEGLFALMDQKTNSRFGINIDQVKAQDVSNKKNSLTTVSGNGRFETGGAWSMEASSGLHDFSQSSHVKASINNFHLPQLSEYAKIAIGYSMKQGLFNLEMDYKIENERLQGNHNLKIDQFHLGDKENQKPLIDAPIPLAISLLKGPGGSINLQVPVDGNINDPQFNLGNVISTAFGNIIIKLVSAPFSILSSLVSSPDQELSLVHFPIGKSDLDDGIRHKLQLLADALKQRPDIRLEIEAFVSEADKKAIHKTYLKEKLLYLNKEEKWNIMIEPENPDLLPLYKTALTKIKTKDGKSIKNDKNLVFADKNFLEKAFQLLFSKEKSDTNSEENTSPEVEINLETLEEILVQYIPLNEDLLHELIDKRITHIINEFTSKKLGIVPNRLIIVNPKKKQLKLSEDQRLEFSVVPQ